MFMILYFYMERSLRKGKFVKIAFLVSMLMLLLFSLTGCDINSIEEYVPNFDNGYYINNYEVNIVIGEDNVYEINEKITATFFDYTNGIVRTIPVEQTIGVPNENEGSAASCTRRPNNADFRPKIFLMLNVPALKVILRMRFIKPMARAFAGAGE